MRIVDKKKEPHKITRLSKEFCNATFSMQLVLPHRDLGIKLLQEIKDD